MMMSQHVVANVVLPDYRQPGSSDHPLHVSLQQAERRRDILGLSCGRVVLPRSVQDVMLADRCLMTLSRRSAATSSSAEARCS